MDLTRVLIIDDEEGIRATFSAFLKKEGYYAATAEDYDTAVEMLSSARFDLVFMDILLGSHTGIEILEHIKKKGYQCPVIMMTGEPDIDTAAASVRLGAFDYLQKPIKRETLVRIAKHALQHKALLDEKRAVESQKEKYRLHLEAIFRSVEDGIVTVDKDFRITQANESFEKICGLKCQDIIGGKTSDISHDCGRNCFGVLRKSMESSRPIHDYRIDCTKADQPEKVILISVSPLRDIHGHEIGAVMIVRDISRLSQLERQLEERHRFHNIIGSSKPMQEVFDLLENLKDIDTTVLITGPSGTGKELVAKAIHYNGMRAAHPFVIVNCSALAENLLESELFGHVKGAFTGAIKDKTGRFQMADHGTIFLDEIGDISPKIQLKLLRFLENKEFERVGESTPMKIDVQVITATNRDLKAQVAAGAFREDLYYRLKVVEIKIPPLSRRRDDIQPIVNHYIEVYNKRFGKHITGISADTERIFREYPWNGNIRELIHALEHAFVVCKKPVIDPGDLPPELREFTAVPRPPQKSASLEKEQIMEALRQNAWNKARAARALKVSRQTMYRKIQEHRIEPPEEV